MTWIRAGRSGVQVLVRAREQSPLQNIQIRSSTHSGSNSIFFSGSKIASAESLYTHIRQESSLKISGVIPRLNLSPSMAHSGTTLFYLNRLPKSISLKKSHSLWSYKGSFSETTYLLHAHYVTYLFHLH